jgi:hypothetical protein
MIYSKAVITPVAVAAILIVGTLTTISSTSQAFAYISYHKGYYHKNHYDKGNHGYYTTYRHTRHVIIVTSNTGDNTANPPYENPPYENPPYENPPYENPPYENPPYENPPYENPPYENPP